MCSWTCMFKWKIEKIHILSDGCTSKETCQSVQTVFEIYFEAEDPYPGNSILGHNSQSFLGTIFATDNPAVDPPHLCVICKEKLRHITRAGKY